MLSQKKSFNMNDLRRSKRKCYSKYSCLEAGLSSPQVLPSLPAQDQETFSLENLSPDCLEQIAVRLDTKAALGEFIDYSKAGTSTHNAFVPALFRSCKKIHEKLFACVHFWKHLCRNEAFQEFNSLKKDNNSNDSDGAVRKSYSGQIFHNIVIPPEATFWHRVYLRGLQMRRNVVSGNYEVWRLFMTDSESCPVMKMTSSTTFRELRSRQRKSSFNDMRRRVRISR